MEMGSEGWAVFDGPRMIASNLTKQDAEVLANADTMTDALKTAALAMDMRAGWALTEDAYNRVIERYGGGMAGAYIKICEALGTIRVTKNKPEESK